MVMSYSIHHYGIFPGTGGMTQALRDGQEMRYLDEYVGGGAHFEHGQGEAFNQHLREVPAACYLLKPQKRAQLLQGRVEK